MTVSWAQMQVTVRQSVGVTGTLRDSWRFTINGGVLTLRGYTREMLPTRRHRKWQLVDVWGSNRRGEDTMTKEQVPMDNVLAVDILAQVALSLEIDFNGLSLPTMGYRLGGVDDSVVDSAGR